MHFWAVCRKAVPLALFVLSLFVMRREWPAVATGPAAASAAAAAHAVTKAPSSKTTAAPTDYFSGVAMGPKSSAETATNVSVPVVCTAKVKTGSDIMGHDLPPSHQVGSMTACCEMCTSTHSCGAFTFVHGTTPDDSSGICWLKNVYAHTLRTNPLCSSGILAERTYDRTRTVPNWKNRRQRKPPKPLPPAPWYAIILWLAPPIAACSLTLLGHAADGVPLFVHEGGMSCDACCEC